LRKKGKSQLKKVLKNKSVVIWGDGAVGRGLAVALSGNLEVFLAGPAGSGRGRSAITAFGALRGNAVVEKIESGDNVHCDYCILALKAYDLNLAADAAMKSTDGQCICLSNGMGLETEWGDSWRDRVEPAVLTAGFFLQDKGLIEVTEGDLIVSAGREAEHIFSESFLNVVPTEKIETVRWAKWLTNSVLNPLGALSGLRNNQLLKAGLGAAAEQLFTELSRVVPAGIRNDAVEKAGKMLSFLFESSSNRCSMLQDIIAGRKTEIEFLTGLYKKRLRRRCPAAAVVTDMIKARASQLYL